MWGYADKELLFCFRRAWDLREKMEREMEMKCGIWALGDAPRLVVRSSHVLGVESRAWGIFQSSFLFLSCFIPTNYTNPLISAQRGFQSILWIWEGDDSLSFLPQGYFVTDFSYNHSLLHANLIFLAHLQNKSDFGASGFFCPWQTQSMCCCTKCPFCLSRPWWQGSNRLMQNNLQTWESKTSKWAWSPFTPWTTRSCASGNSWGNSELALKGAWSQLGWLGNGSEGWHRLSLDGLTHFGCCSHK